MSLSTAQIQANIDALATAIAAGAQTVEISTESGTRRITYHSLATMEAVLNRMCRSLAIQQRGSSAGIVVADFSG